jgi:hypothetical protein
VNRARSQDTAEKKHHENTFIVVYNTSEEKRNSFGF